MTATRTDAAIKDTPQSIQVLPQQVIKDQQSTRLTEVLKNAPGVVIGDRSPRDPLNIYKIRGFTATSDTLYNGLQDRSVGNIGFGSNIDRVEVLKGPSSVKRHLHSVLHYHSQSAARSMKLEPRQI